MSDLPEIASLWIGDRLSWFEQLCLKSFADAGHPTTLYSYTPIANLPAGVRPGDAAEIFPAKPLLRHARVGSPAIHADIWRLHLLAKTDKIWVDADMYCYRPFQPRQGYLFGWEKPDLVCNAVLALPRDSAALIGLIDFFKDGYAIAPWLKRWQQRDLRAARDAGQPVHITEQKWGFTGPAAVTYFLKQTGEIAQARPETAFYPIPYAKRRQMVRSGGRIEEKLSTETLGVHFWARRLKPHLQEEHDNRPQPGSFMHRLLEKHEIDPAAAPIPPKVYPAPKAAPRQGLTENPDDPLLRNYLIERHFLQAAHVSTAAVGGRDFVYMKNHKAACTTILATLMAHQLARLGQPDEARARASAHMPPRWLIRNGKRALTVPAARKALQDPARFKFTVVRDPVARTLSAYADKIAGNQGPKRALMKHLGRPADSDLSLGAFLDILAQDPVARNIDRHWRSQRRETCYDQIAYDFVGDTATLDTAFQVILQACFGTPDGKVQDTRTLMGHSSNSAALRAELTATDRKNLERAFAEDFDMYEQVRKTRADA